MRTGIPFSFVRVLTDFSESDKLHQLELVNKIQRSAGAEFPDNCRSQAFILINGEGES